MTFQLQLSVPSPFKHHRSSLRRGRTIETFNECDFKHLVCLSDVTNEPVHRDRFSFSTKCGQNAKNKGKDTSGPFHVVIFPATDTIDILAPIILHRVNGLVISEKCISDPVKHEERTPGTVQMLAKAGCATQYLWNCIKPGASRSYFPVAENPVKEIIHHAI